MPYIDETGGEFIANKIIEKVQIVGQSDWEEMKEDAKPKNLYCVPSAGQKSLSGDIVVYTGEKLETMPLASVLTNTYDENTFKPVGIVLLDSDRLQKMKVYDDDTSALVMSLGILSKNAKVENSNSWLPVTDSATWMNNGFMTNTFEDGILYHDLNAATIDYGMNLYNDLATDTSATTSYNPNKAFANGFRSYCWVKGCHWYFEDGVTSGIPTIFAAEDPADVKIGYANNNSIQNYWTTAPSWNSSGAAELRKVYLPTDDTSIAKIHYIGQQQAGNDLWYPLNEPVTYDGYTWAPSSAYPAISNNGNLPAVRGSWHYQYHYSDTYPMASTHRSPMDTPEETPLWCPFVCNKYYWETDPALPNVYKPNEGGDSPSQLKLTTRKWDYAPLLFTDGAASDFLDKTKGTITAANSNENWNALSDFGGYENTAYLCESTEQTGWKDWATWRAWRGGMEPGRKNSLPATMCWCFHPSGTQQGEWYLPAVGEISLIIMYQKYLDSIIGQLNTWAGRDIAAQVNPMRTVMAANNAISQEAKPDADFHEDLNYCFPFDQTTINSLYYCIDNKVTTTHKNNTNENYWMLKATARTLGNLGYFTSTVAITKAGLVFSQKIGMMPWIVTMGGCVRTVQKNSQFFVRPFMRLHG